MLGKPIMDRILLKPVKVEQVGSIVTPDKYQTSDKYEVVAIGDFVILGGQRFPIHDFVTVGDLVLVSEYNVEAVDLEGQKLFLSRVQDIRLREKTHVAPRTLTTTALSA